MRVLVAETKASSCSVYPSCRRGVFLLEVRPLFSLILRLTLLQFSPSRAKSRDCIFQVTLISQNPSVGNTGGTYETMLASSI